ncbi:MAG: ring hydroxylating beta subunit [Ramlibacter sp.]|nr:ring hydroxylating beta subunit [Ramlibacter sp.]
MNAPGFNQAEIERLLSDFAWHADRGAGAELAALFLPDGMLRVGGLDMKGRTEIADDCYRRAADAQRKTRHVWSNLRIEGQGENSVRATAIQLTFEMRGADEPAKLRVNDLFDEFRRDEQGHWRFASRKVERQAALVLGVSA